MLGTELRSTGSVVYVLNETFLVGIFVCLKAKEGEKEGGRKDLFWKFRHSQGYLRL